MPSPDPPPLGALVGALSGSADVASLARVLTGSLADALPPDLVEVRYRRTTADRFAGRPGTPTGITVRTPDGVLALDAGRSGAPEASVSRVVRGVVLSRTRVDLASWIEALAEALRAAAATDEAARASVERFLLG